MIQLNVRVSEELKKQVQRKCIDEGMRLNQVITELLSQWVGESVSIPLPTTTVEVPLPKTTVEVPPPKDFKPTPLPGWASVGLEEKSKESPTNPLAWLDEL